MGSDVSAKLFIEESSNSMNRYTEARRWFRRVFVDAPVISLCRISQVRQVGWEGDGLKVRRRLQKTSGSLRATRMFARSQRSSTSIRCDNKHLYDNGRSFVHMHKHFNFFQGSPNGLVSIW